MTPPMKPIAENARQIIESSVIKALYKGTKIEKVILKFAKALSSLAPMLGIVDIVISINAPDKNKIILDRIDQNREEILNQINKNQEIILSRFNDIERILNVGFDTVERKIVFDKFLQLLSNMKSESEHFELIIQSYNSNEEKLISKLDDFIKHYENEKLESKFVNQLTQTFAGMKSALNFLYERALIDQKNVFNPKKTSPNQIMLELYHSTLHLIYKGYSMLSFCYSLKDELRNQSSDTDQEFVKAKMNQDIDNLNKAFRNLQSTAGNDGLDTNINLSIREMEYNPHKILPFFIYGSLYMGKIQVEKEGHVITGVRFNKIVFNYRKSLNGQIIYFQIQVGQLLPSGLIDENSVYWQDLPNDLKKYKQISDPHTSGFGIASSKGKCYIELRDLSFDNCILTGLQFTMRKIPKGIREATIYSFKIYGRRYENQSLGDEHELEGINSDDLSCKRYCYNPYLNDQNLSDPQAYIITKNRVMNDFCSLIPDPSEVTLDKPMPLSGIGLMHYTNDKKYSDCIEPYLRKYSGCIKPYLKTFHFKNIL